MYIDIHDIVVPCEGTTCSMHVYIHDIHVVHDVCMCIVWNLFIFKEFHYIALFRFLLLLLLLLFTLPPLPWSISETSESLSSRSSSSSTRANNMLVVSSFSSSSSSSKLSLFRRPFAARFWRVCRCVLRSVCCCCCCPPPPSLSPPRRKRRLWKNFDGMMIMIYSENKNGI